MSTLQISKANALVAYESATPKQKALLTNLLGKSVFLKAAIGRIKSYEDACEDQAMTPLTLAAFSFLPEQDRKHAFASHKLTVIIKSLNEEWIPNWSDSNEAKYYGWFKLAGSGSGFSFCDCYCDSVITYVGSRLVFKTRALAEYAGKQFESIYSDYLSL